LTDLVLSLTALCARAVWNPPAVFASSQLSSF
jgi:hypothetical protein